MKIVRLQAEGFKRIQAVDITPDGEVVAVRGDNGEGKSSVLDSIYAALGGAAGAPLKPVREGEEYAIIRADLGDLKVTRYFGSDGADRLTVENAEGAKFSEPQTMLNGLVGAIAFDPLAFARMNAKDQAAELRRLVPLSVNLDAFAAADKADTVKRRDINRDAKAMAARIEAVPAETGLPEERPDLDALTAKLASAADTNTAIERERGRRATAREGVKATRQRATEESALAARLRREADEAEAEAARLNKNADEREVELDRLPPLDDPIDTTAARAALDEARALSARFDRHDYRASLTGQFEKLRADSEAFTAAIGERAKLREEALKAAKMPVPGLSLATIDDDLIVTLDNVPFSQASGAQQLRASMALAMAANPKLRVMLIKDGSLLDSKGMQLVRELAKERDYQIWLEAVGEGDGVGIIMEAGKVRGADEPERVTPPKRRQPKSAAGGDDDKAAATSRATSPIPGDMAQAAVQEPAAPAPAPIPAAPPPRRKPSEMRRPVEDLFGDK